MNKNYPIEKANKLNIHIDDFINDIDYMTNVIDKLGEWESRGLSIGNSIESLNNQIEVWNLEMKELIQKFSDVIYSLKELDDRIDSKNSIEINLNDNSYKQQWLYLLDIYNQLFINLKNDVNILNSVNTDINKYKELGIKLGDATETIENQINNIDNGLNASLIDLDELIKDIEIYSKKILTDNEVETNIMKNNLLAVYSTISVGANTFLLYFNLNQQIQWDSIKDGTNILNHVKKALLSNKSEIYNDEIGDIHYNTESTELYNWIYYGFDKNNMIKARILNEGNGASYQDEHGYQMILNIFYDKSTNILEELKILFEQNNMNYSTGSDTKHKLYIVFSIEEISDFTNITFRGE